MTVYCTFDGACEPFNPGGDMGLGWTIDGTGYSEYIPAAVGNTNNVAEYLALSRVLDHLLAHREITAATVKGDSQLVVNQLGGEYAVKSPNLYPHFQRVKDQLDQLGARGCQVSTSWHPRELNQEADEQSKQALREHGVAAAERGAPDGWTSRLGDIAIPLGISAVALGKHLTALGLKDGRKATQAAEDQDYACSRFDGYGLVTDWHIEKVTALVKPLIAGQKTQIPTWTNRLEVIALLVDIRLPVLLQRLAEHGVIVKCRIPPTPTRYGRHEGYVRYLFGARTEWNVKKVSALVVGNKE